MSGTLSAVMAERTRLINLAYRMLGSLADAEDAVQETYARWYAMSAEQQDAIESPGAWLTTAASRICLDLLGSARARRERYVGEWIPEPRPLPRLRRPGRPAWSGTSSRPGKPRTSRPSSACWTPAPPWSPTAAAWSPPRLFPSKAASRWPATWPTSPAGCLAA